MIDDQVDATLEFESGGNRHESGIGYTGANCPYDELGLTVADFPVLEYSKKKVLKAGEALKGDLVWTPETQDKIIGIFKIANSWRDSHTFPMRSIRGEVSARIFRLGLDGTTVARIKRMPSIRKKLRRLPYKLNQIQDLGGVRSILVSMEQANKLIYELKTKSRNEFYDEDDYVNKPKWGGYRSHHIIFKYVGKTEDAAFDGRRIEIQIRTRLQHAWATAVEAIGLLKDQDMKAGEGDPDWLRLFELVSAEFALAENCAIPPHLPDRQKRIEEIRQLDRNLGVVQVLDGLRYAARALDEFRFEGDRISYYLVEFNHQERRVDVRSRFAPKELLLEYGARELESITGLNSIKDTVLIEANKVEDLKNAYPNYFGDFQVFISNLQRITEGGEAIEYTMPPRYTAPRSAERPGDTSWLRPGSHRRWREPAAAAKKSAKKKKSSRKKK